MRDGILEIEEQIKGYLLYAQLLGITELPLERREKAEEPGTTVSAAEEMLKAIRSEMGDCSRCHLHKTRTNLVFGDGNPNAKVMFVGEAPGADEDAQGIPFVGRAGQLLNRVLEMIGMPREEVYIANILKCRPPGNRTPAPEEIAVCMPFLLRQVEAIQPKVICALGAVAMNALMGKKMPITKVRGTTLKTPHGYTLVPTFHPAYLLRNPNEKKKFIQDLQEIKRMYYEG
jgi:uracil-DNA glycosylase family 4